MTDIHKIVIIGGGAGGLELATQLGDRFGKNAKAEICLIDPHLTHIWKPLLPEIAAGTLNTQQEETHYFSHAAKHGYQFILGTFIDLDRQHKCITVRTEHWDQHLSTSSEHPPTTQQLDYDTLILALGSTSHDFHTQGVQQYCHFLDDLHQAKKLQHDIQQLFIDAQYLPPNEAYHIVVIGAGTTGVELVNELIHAKNTLFISSGYHINLDKVQLHIVEAKNRILPAQSEPTSCYIHNKLSTSNIHIHTQRYVSHVDAQSIYFQDGTTLSANIKIWAAGIQASAAISHLVEFEKDSINRLHVLPTLQTTIDLDIFALGDCAYYQPTPQQPALQPRAQVASQQAHFLVRALKARLNQTALPHFHYTQSSSLFSLKRYPNINYLLMKMNVQDFLAKSQYFSLYRTHQANIHGYTYARLLTAKDLMTKKTASKLKLH